jgi:cyclophilin family peptidyl-prolyl cis-trans isomerase
MEPVDNQFWAKISWMNFLPNRNTIFGRAVKGIDVIEKISQAKTDRFEKTIDEMKIIPISIKSTFSLGR